MKNVQESKLNNKGFTLVELLVCVAILAIIVLPILNSFVVSVNTNTKARKRAAATEVAKDIMENLESADYNSLTLSGAMFAGKTAVEIPRTDIAGEPVYTDDERLNGSDELKKEIAAADKRTYFKVDNIAMNGKTYQAIVKFEAGSESVQKINNQALINVNAIDERHDAVASSMLSEELPTAVISKLNNNVGPGQVITQADVKRTITLESRLYPTNNSVMEVNVTYKYESAKLASPVSRTYTIYTQSLIGSMLDNVYLFFYPWYTSTDIVNPSDTIVIKNSLNDSVKGSKEVDGTDVETVFDGVNVYLVKQRYSECSDSRETNYKVNIVVKDGAGDNPTGESKYVNLRTNLWDNLSGFDGITHTYEPLTSSNGKYVINSWPVSTPVAVNYNSDVIKRIYTYDNTHSYSFVEHTLAAKEPTDRAYEVTVYVFDSTDNMFSLTGADGFVTSITGGMVD